MATLNLLHPDFQHDLLSFTQRLVQTKSFSGQEGDAIRLAEKQMLALGYDDVIIDLMGNLLGRIGTGEKSILFDSHIDTVAVTDAEEWEVPPFGGDVVNGKLYGRGAVDMKSALAASVYAGALAKERGIDPGKSIYVSCTVMEEECDGENLKHLFKERSFKPGYVVICEPSENQIVLGHKGKAQVSIKTHGISAHSSAPEDGLNAVYEMAEIIQRVERTNAELAQMKGPTRTLALSRISSTSASINAVPSECEIYLDRRIAPGETEEAIRKEMDTLIDGKRATWEVGTLNRRSWTGMEISYHPFHMAWRIEPEHELVKACTAAYSESFGREPAGFGFWDFSTNAVIPVSLGIPTIGFGPGNARLAHMRNEHCEVRQILEACEYYASLMSLI